MAKRLQAFQRTSHFPPRIGNIVAKKKKPSASPKSSPKTVSFEEAFAQLQQVVEQLERGNLTLSESLESYQQGIKSLKACHVALDQVKKKIELLVELDENGEMISQPFDASATRSPGRQRARRSPTVEETSDSEWEDDMDDDETLF